MFMHHSSWTLSGSMCKLYLLWFPERKCFRLLSYIEVVGGSLGRQAALVNTGLACHLLHLAAPCLVCEMGSDRWLHCLHGWMAWFLSWLIDRLGSLAQLSELCPSLVEIVMQSGSCALDFAVHITTCCHKKWQYRSDTVYWNATS